MSTGSQEKRVELLFELRQFNGCGASFFRAAAARIGLTVTDMQVIDILDITGPLTAGQLADRTGLTTGAITGMLNRLEEAGHVRRESDPNDGRRVIVHLSRGKEEIGPIFASMDKAWNEMASHYSDEQIAFLLEFLKRSNTIARQEIGRLRETPAGDGRSSSAPLGDLERARLVVSNGISRLTLRANEQRSELYHARFEGSMPDVKSKDGVVTIRYRRRLWLPTIEQRSAEIILNTAIPWEIMIRGGLSEAKAHLGNLNLAGLEVTGGFSTSSVELPVPSGLVPIRISGGAAVIIIRRPAGVAARVHLKGWASQFVFDDQTFSHLGNDVQLQSPGFKATAPGYDIEVASSASQITITTG